MELVLTDDQQFFRDTTHRFLGAECSTTAVRALAGTAAGCETGFWRQGAELGWTSMLVPEALGGGSVSGSGPVDLTIVADAFGRYVAPGPLVPTNVVAAAVARAGTDDQQARVLPGLLSGQLVAAWCGAEAALQGHGAIDATRTADGWVLTGVSGPVEAAVEADELLVTARSDGGLVQVLVPAAADGVSVTPLRSLDLVRRFGRVELQGLTAPADAQVGEVGEAAADVERQLQHALLIQTAQLVGAAQRTFDFTVEWAFDRYSFGRPLASYQELKHRFADMKMWLEASHALVSALAREIHAGATGTAETASVAKAYAGHHLAELAQDCLQMHGGIGLTADHDLHLYLRRITTDRSLHGTPSDHRQRIAAIAAERTAA